jgi:hypothetical protein
MCLQDIQIGRKSNGTQYIVAISNATSRQLVPANIQRVALIISPPASGYITVSFANTAVIDQGINIPSSSPPVILTIENTKGLLTRPMTVIHSAAAMSLGVWESSFDERNF